MKKINVDKFLISIVLYMNANLVWTREFYYDEMSWEIFYSVNLWENVDLWWKVTKAHF